MLYHSWRLAGASPRSGASGGLLAMLRRETGRVAATAHRIRICADLGLANSARGLFLTSSAFGTQHLPRTRSAPDRGGISKLAPPERRSLSTLLIGSHLSVSDVATGQAAVPHRREEPASSTDRNRQKTRPLAAPRRSADSQLRSGYPLPSSRIRRHFLILFAARQPKRLVR
jgi:hypothetical protein